MTLLRGVCTSTAYVVVTGGVHERTTTCDYLDARIAAEDTVDATDALPDGDEELVFGVRERSGTDAVGGVARSLLTGATVPAVVVPPETA